MNTPNPNAVIVPQCTHVKTNGEVCGSPAMSGTELCYHHSTVKSALGNWTPAGQVAYGEFTAIPFIFPEDRASLQIDYFLLFQALKEERVERRAAEVLFRMLKAMATNLGKSGTLVDQNNGQRSAVSDQGTGNRQQATANSDPSGAVSDLATGNRQQAIGNSDPVDNKEAISVQASAGAEVFAGPIAAESCFSTKPAARSLTDVRRELFRMSSFHPAGQRLLNLYFKPVEREEWRTDRRKFHGF
jgi:hypothetical protein